MSQATMVLGNVNFPAARIALNENFEALVTLSSGATAPATTFSGMLWHDTTANVIKLRDETDTAWISLFAIDQGGGLAKPSTPDVLDEDDFATDSATRPPSQQSTKAYVDAVVVVGRSPANVDSSRTGSTWYQNATSRVMFVTSNRRSSFSSTPRDVEITDNQSSPGAGFPMVVSKTSTQDSPRLMYSFLVPPGHYWRWNGGMEGDSGATYTVEYT